MRRRTKRGQRAEHERVLEKVRNPDPEPGNALEATPVGSLVVGRRRGIDDTLARLGRLGATVVDDVVDYEDICRLCYIRGPEGILIGLAQQLG